MRQIPTLLLLCALLVNTSTLASESAQVTPSGAAHETQSVIEKFWTALGELDPEAIKQTLNWPVSIVEASETQTNNPQPLMTPLDFDKEFQRSSPHSASGRSEFYGAKLSTFKLQMLNESLAVVTYSCEWPNEARNSSAKPFRAVTILRRDPSGRGSWKILFITVPK